MITRKRLRESEEKYARIWKDMVYDKPLTEEQIRDLNGNPPALEVGSIANSQLQLEHSEQWLRHMRKNARERGNVICFLCGTKDCERNVLYINYEAGAVISFNGRDSIYPEGRPCRVFLPSCDVCRELATDSCKLVAYPDQQLTKQRDGRLSAYCSVCTGFGPHLSNHYRPQVFKDKLV